jgi:hypothetical protein
VLRLTHFPIFVDPAPNGNDEGQGLGDQTLRKTSRLRRLRPGWGTASPAPASRGAINAVPAFPARGLDAAELIAMVRQARTGSDARDPTEFPDVF